MGGAHMVTLDAPPDYSRPAVATTNREGGPDGGGRTCAPLGVHSSRNSGTNFSDFVSAAQSSPGSSMQQQRAPASTKQQPAVNKELLKRARQHVKEAIKEKKIFSVQGPYPVMRKLLRARGWVEKLTTTIKEDTCPVQQEPKKLLEEKQEDGSGEEKREAVLHAEPGSVSCWAPCSGENLELPEEEEEQQEEVPWYAEDPDGIHDIMSSMVKDHLPTFIWTNRRSAVHYRELQDHQMVNHFTGTGAFTTKKGLCVNLQNLPSFYQADPTTFFPRCYQLGDEAERQAFIEDFRLTAAHSLLKLAVEKPGIMQGVMESPGKGAGPVSPSPPELLEKALQVCRMQLDRLEHTDIDRDSPLLHITNANWDCFLHEYYRVVNKQSRLEASIPQIKHCRALLQKLQERLPQLHMEGVHNLWIIKPGAMSRGRGITCSARLEEIVELPGKPAAPSARPGQWIVQKYVERPLLIFGTKIDLRQWILVTDWNPLTIWFYRDSYVRFCSQPFSLSHLHASRHLCNVSIQKQWRQAAGRNPNLPCDLIWSSHQLQLHLQQVGHTEAWENVIVPGMKEAVVATLHSCRELVRDRKDSFELYGADFIFGEDCQPWLLEINASPTMAPCSAVTRQLCAAVQRDILRVVLDHRENHSCSTGAFELIHKEVGLEGLWDRLLSAPKEQAIEQEETASSYSSGGLGGGLGTITSPKRVPIVPVPPCLGLKLLVEGYSLMKFQLQKQQPQDKLPTTLPLVCPVVPKSLVVAKPLMNTKSSVVPMSPVVPRPPVVAKLLMDKQPMVTNRSIVPKPPAVPMPPVVSKPLTDAKPPMVLKTPEVPRPPVVAKPLMDTKPTVVPSPPVVPKPLTVTKPPMVTMPPIEPRSPTVSRPPVMSKWGTTTQLPPPGEAQVKVVPLTQLHFCLSSASAPQAPPQPNPLLQWRQATLSKPGATVLTGNPHKRPQSHQQPCLHVLGSRAVLQPRDTKQHLGAGRNAATKRP
ncbi:tubulin tyrosine ligase 3-like [Pezoporus wallicus]|uniref:tubulin tyrosine ligase 3-like n=1 Tax=Pezoporus wallicus TaxID=35540 RepID=UPI002551787A|nr:tubulin tyrosine ligase 3-like [Pezoporus wallicus]